MTDNYPCTKLCMFAQNTVAQWVDCPFVRGGIYLDDPCPLHLNIMDEANRRNRERREAAKRATRRPPCRRTFVCPKCGGKRFHIERESGLRAGFFPDVHRCSSCGWGISDRKLVRTFDPDRRTVWSLKDD